MRGRPKKVKYRTVFGLMLDTLGLTQAAAAEKLNLSRTYVRLLAHGMKKPSFSTMLAIESWAKSNNFTLSPDSWK